MTAARLDSMRETGYAVSMLRREARSLTLMAANLDAAFYGAVECLAGVKGRIAVTGTGKNIHVGRKVASSLLSAGLSVFSLSLEAAEYGEVGMLRPDDAVLAFSDSGDAPALSVLIRHTERYGIPIVGVTRHVESLLGRHAAHLILLPGTPDADASDSVLATSATLQMALGDALAMSLMRRKGGASDELLRLGTEKRFACANLLMVKDVMHVKSEVPLVTAPTPMPEVLNLMTEKGFGVVGVVVKGRLAGIITDEALRRRMRGGKKPGEIARDVMRPASITVEETTLVETALRLMQERGIYALFVTRAGSPVGILNVYDCLRAVAE